MNDQSNLVEPDSSRDQVGTDLPEHDALENLPEDRDPGEGEVASTGNDRVDAVLDATEGLEQLPVDDHVAVFESAHGELRAALDGRPEPADPHAGPSGD